jgi:anti-anti-sigma regulatory factor
VISFSEPSELTEIVDARAGLIRARGRLTAQGADLISGTADSLRGSGHSRVVLDLREVRTADDAGLDILDHLRLRFRDAGGQLIVTDLPVAEPAR